MIIAAIPIRKTDSDQGKLAIIESIVCYLTC